MSHFLKYCQLQVIIKCWNGSRSYCVLKYKGFPFLKSQDLIQEEIELKKE